MSDSRMIDQLQHWFQNECNGDWEHTYGVTIKTSDNPGWIFEVDLWETDLAQRVEEEKRFFNSEDDWMNVFVRHEKFQSSCSIKNLGKLIEEFIYFSKNKRLSR